MKTLTEEERKILLEAIRQVRKQPRRQSTKEELLDFCYGNLACTTNHKPSLQAFWYVAEKRGWIKEEFDKWAAGKKWWNRD